MGVGAGVAAAAIPAITSIAGAVGGSQNSGGQTQTASNAPWAPQQPYLESGFGQAQTNLNNANAIPIPSNFVAPQNPNQASADAGLFGVGSSAPQQAQTWQADGQLGATQYPEYLANAQALTGQGIGAMSPATSILQNYAATGSMPGESTVDPTLGASLTAAGTQGVQSLGMGQTAALQAAQAGLNPNGTINAAVNGANAMTSNPGLQAAINAANQSTVYGLTEDTLPQIQASAMQSGNANSSREGALEAIATRGAQTNMANTAAQMELGAYTQGANLGATGYNQGLQTAVSGAQALNTNGYFGGGMLSGEQGLQQNQQQFGVTSQLGAANNAATQDLNYQNSNFNAQLQGNAQAGQAVQNGLQDQMGGLNYGLTGLNAAYTGATNDQAGTQAGLNNIISQYQAQTQDPATNLQNYWKIVSGNMGSSSNSTMTPNNGGLGGALAGAIGGGTAGYGLYNNLSNSGLFGDGNGGITYGTSGYNADPSLQSSGATSLQSLGLYNPL